MFNDHVGRTLRNSVVDSKLKMTGNLRNVNITGDHHNHNPYWLKKKQHRISLGTVDQSQYDITTQGEVRAIMIQNVITLRRSDSRRTRKAGIKGLFA